MKHFLSPAVSLSPLSLSPSLLFPLPPSPCMSFICSLVLDPLQHGILMVGAVDPHRCPMTGCTDGPQFPGFPCYQSKHLYIMPQWGRETVFIPGWVSWATSTCWDQGGQRLHAESTECAIVPSGRSRDCQLHVLPSDVRDIHTQPSLSQAQIQAPHQM